MTLALYTGRAAGLAVDPAAFEGAAAWVDSVTDPASGRVGYDRRGGPSSRTDANRHYPTDRAEAMTAAGLLVRILAAAATGRDAAADPTALRQAELVLARPPVWEPQAHGCDFYAWHFGTYALFHLGGDLWPRWERQLKATLTKAQRKGGDDKGSWDPVGPWGHAGGRVYSTALGLLCLQAYFREPRLTGAVVK